ncbi:MAG TPA: cell division protein SepF [Fimbriimonas sp.]|nr:cell division protein SepF [Fimbriimonas sp.]
MDESLYEEKPGLFSRVAGLFNRPEVYEDELEETQPAATRGVRLKSNYRYTVTVRRQITCFEDALAAANGLKSGEQQILNLSGTDSATRQKIVDFMSGVNYAQEGTWEEIGENIYLIVPQHAYVEMVPASTRGTALRN